MPEVEVTRESVVIRDGARPVTARPWYAVAVNGIWICQALTPLEALEAARDTLQDYGAAVVAALEAEEARQ